MITVITPTLNSERFIEGCLRNVIDQSCQNVEHIIVDGGSTDGTVEIVKRYAASYKHIRWISEKDRGQSDAMNKGIAMAHGDVLGFLNVDDYYHSSGVLNRVAELFVNLSEPHLLVGNCHIVDGNDKLILINKPAKVSLFRVLINRYPVNSSAYFYHASLHQKIGLYDISEHYAMDLSFLLLAAQFAPIKYVDEDWGVFRLIEGTKTYVDMQHGTSKPRVEELLRDFRKRLPPLQRLAVALSYSLYNSEAMYWRVLRMGGRIVNKINLRRFLK